MKEVIFTFNYSIIFIEHLLCVRHCSRFWEYGHEQDKKKIPVPVEFYILVGIDKKAM